MAETVSGANYTKHAAPSPGTFMGAEWDGRVVAEHDSYTCAALATGSTINVGVLKPGEVFLFGAIRTADLGMSTTIALGDAGDIDRYMAATAASANAYNAMAAAGIGYKNETAVDIPICVHVTGTCTGALETVICKARQ